MGLVRWVVRVVGATFVEGQVAWVVLCQLSVFESSSMCVIGFMSVGVDHGMSSFSVRVE